MDFESCINEPLFRTEFVKHEIDALSSVIDGNSNMIYHNDAKISILNEIKQRLELNDLEIDVVNEHLGALNSLRDDALQQNERLKIMVEIYGKFVKKPIETNLKLA